MIPPNIIPVRSWLFPQVPRGIVLAIPSLLILISCSVQTTTQRTRVERPNVQRDNSILRTSSTCIDTLREMAGRTKTIPPRVLYRDVAYVYQVQADVDLRVTDRFGESTLAIVALTPDDVLSRYLLRWKEAVHVSPRTATFSILVKTTARGTGYLKVVSQREKEFSGEEIRATGVPVVF